MGASHRHCRILSPAKINLCLSVTGRGSDGYHRLLSIAWRTRFGDYLDVREVSPGEAAGDVISCNDPRVPVDGTNLVCRALAAVRSVVEIPRFLEINLDKRIPPGSGLGGGSSNAVAILKVLAQWYPDRLDAGRILAIATRLGSDCPLFLQSGPCLMEGRGEICVPLPERIWQAFSGQPIWLIRPDFEISTQWAYSLLAQNRFYSNERITRTRLASWLEEAPATWPDPGNDFERLLPQWIPSFHLVINSLRQIKGVRAHLSGSGSAIFAAVPPSSGERVLEILRNAWGSAFWHRETQLE